MGLSRCLLLLVIATPPLGCAARNADGGKEEVPEGFEDCRFALRPFAVERKGSDKDSEIKQPENLGFVIISNSNLVCGCF